MFHLSHKHDRPCLAKRVFMLSQLHNEQITAITYGLYNKAVLEGTWLDNHQSGFVLNCCFFQMCYIFEVFRQ